MINRPSNSANRRGTLVVLLGRDQRLLSENGDLGGRSGAQSGQV